jgi:hypothetical protein
VVVTLSSLELKQRQVAWGCLRLVSIIDCTSGAERAEYRQDFLPVLTGTPSRRKMCRAERRRSITTTILPINSFQIRGNICAALQQLWISAASIAFHVIAWLVPATPHSGIILA